MSALSNKQKYILASLARRAFRRSAAIARGLGQPLAEDENTWRHERVAEAVGKPGLRACGQEDFKTIEGHFLHLLGQDGQAVESHFQAATEPRRVAEFKVIQACEKWGFSLNYADAICRRQNHGTGMQDVDDKTLYHLMFTIINRGRSRARKAA